MDEDELILSKLCKVSPVSIEIIDIKNDQLLCSSGWIVDRLGYTEAEFDALSKNLFEKLVHPEDRARQIETFDSLFREPDSLFKETTIRILAKNGEYNTIQIRLAILQTDREKKPCTVLSTVMDVGEVIALRQQLDKQLKKLEIISFKNSHDLRGPVATILGLISLIEHDHFEGAHAKEIIGSLKKTVIKLDEVIHEINAEAN
jgi:signal transduction histidine kinase